MENVPKHRPTRIIVFGIIHLLMAFLSLFGVAALVLQLVVEPNPQDPVATAFANSMLLQGWIVVSLVLAVINLVLLLAGGIGLLLDRLWGLRVSAIYAWLTIAAAVIGTGITLLAIVPVAVEVANDPSSDPAAIGGAVGGAVGGVCGGLFALVYPVVVLAVLVRPPVRAYLAAMSGASDPRIMDAAAPQ